MVAPCCAVVIIVPRGALVECRGAVAATVELRGAMVECRGAVVAMVEPRGTALAGAVSGLFCESGRSATSCSRAQ